MMTRHLPRILPILLLVLAALPARGDFTLFDGTLNTTPNAQGWLYLTNPLFNASATQTASPTGTTLDTTAVQSESAGYFAHLGSFTHPQLPILDRATGYTIKFDVAVEAESHASTNRAGFSLIVLSQDLKGIELGFWTDRIWAQADGAAIFTQAEGVARSTSALTSYALSVSGDAYRLFAGGVEVLSGPLRDYSPFGTPYNTPSFVFLGDDTSSASARVKLASVGGSLTTVPEPGAWSLFALGMGGVVAGRTVRRRWLNPARDRGR